MIPDDVIDRYLDTYFGHSEPGAILSHLLIASAGAGDLNALGLPDPDKLKVTIYAIAPTAEVNAGTFVMNTIKTAMVEAHRNGTVIHFAALTMEIHTVPDDGNEVTENRARLLMADQKLNEHPAAIEVTRLYAACRDGRRWTGSHYLTGVRAGTVDGPEVCTGGLGPKEDGPHQRLVRVAVGI